MYANPHEPSSCALAALPPVPPAAERGPLPQHTPAQGERRGAVAVLRALLERSNRTVFANTEQGYEGSGRGFRLRFEAMLAGTMPQFRRARLEQPVRWAPADPLEALVNRALVLDADIDAGATIIDRSNVDRVIELTKGRYR